MLFPIVKCLTKYFQGVSIWKYRRSLLSTQPAVTEASILHPVSMDSEKAAESHVKKKILADAFKLQLRIDALDKGTEGPRRISAEFMVKKVKLPTGSKVPPPRAWPLVPIPETERVYTEKSASRTITRFGKVESTSKSKKAAEGEKGGTIKGTNNHDSSSVISGAEEDRELTKKKAILAAAAFEKWVAETEGIESETITFQNKSDEASPSLNK